MYGYLHEDAKTEALIIYRFVSHLTKMQWHPMRQEYDSNQRCLSNLVGNVQEWKNCKMNKKKGLHDFRKN